VRGSGESWTRPRRTSPGCRPAATRQSSGPNTYWKVCRQECAGYCSSGWPLRQPTVAGSAQRSDMPEIFWATVCCVPASLSSRPCKPVNTSRQPRKTASSPMPWSGFEGCLSDGVCDRLRHESEPDTATAFRLPWRTVDH
jgi:hypothetical protein